MYSILRRTKAVFIFSFSILLFLSSCVKDDNPTLSSELDNDLERLILNHPDIGSLEALIFPNSWDLEEIPSDVSNPLNPYKVKLGSFLFHDTGLALDAKEDEGALTYSCASCHHAQGGFQACLPQGIGDGGLGFGMTGEARVKSDEYNDEDLDVQPLRTPSVLNTAYQEVMLWNGQFGAVGINEGTESEWTADTPKETNHLGFEGLETQAIAGLDVHRLVIDEEKISEIAEYVHLFENAFPNENDEINKTNAGLAIAAYERTILSTEAPFQQWLKGDLTAMTDIEKRGASLFFGKANCASCHNSPALNSMEFHAYGMNELSGAQVFNVQSDDPARLGRGSFTGDSSDDYKFKVPQLYNLKDSPFYGHGSSFRSIKEIVEYKNAAIAESAEVPESNLAAEFVALNLTSVEINELVSFIETALYDKNLDRFVPAELPSGQCFPNADIISQEDLNCL